MNYIIDEIESIECLGECNEYLYDIGMEDTPHTFFANDILVHNSVYMSARSLIDLNNIVDFEASKKFTIELCKFMEDKINIFYDKFCPKMFNTKIHYIKIASDVIAVRAVWLAKKAYAMLKVYDIETGKSLIDEKNKDGKLEVKGLGTVRSNFPEMFKIFMTDVLISILTNISEKDMNKKVIDFKEKLKTLPLIQIAKPSSVGELSKWIKKEKGRTPFTEIPKIRNEDGKNYGCPAHIKGAIFYNDFLIRNKLDDKYEKIRDGEKAKLIYLKNNPLNIDGLSFKGYNDPKEVMDFIEMYVDREEIFEAELLNKLENFYKALKWKYPSENEVNAAEFLEF